MTTQLILFPDRRRDPVYKQSTLRKEDGFFQVNVYLFPQQYIPKTQMSAQDNCKKVEGK